MQRRQADRGRWRGLLLAGVVLSLVAGTTARLHGPEVVLTTAPTAGLAAPAAAVVPAVAAVAPGGETLRLTSGGADRAVVLEGPTAAGPARGLVVVLGGHGLTAARTASDLRLDDLRARGYAVAYPSTQGGDWNAGRCCGQARRAGVDDVGFLDDVRTALLARFALPASAVGLVGWSSGGQMAYRLLCEDPGYAAAAVVVAGSLETACHPAGTLPPVLVVHGRSDGTVPWAPPTRRTSLLDYAPTPAVTSVAAFAHAAGCARPVLDTTDGRTLMAWPGCAAVPQLTFVGMPGTGHGWAALHGSTYVTRFLPPHLGTT